MSAPKPTIDVDRAAQLLLTDREMEALGLVLPLLEKLAKKNFAPLTRIQVRRWVDPEEGGSEVVVREWVDLPTEDALEYWDRVGSVFDDWVKRQPSRTQEVIRERIQLEIIWQVDE